MLTLHNQQRAVPISSDLSCQICCSETSPIDSWNLGLFSFLAILLTTVSQKAIAGANDTSQSCESITDLFRKTPVSASTFKTLSIFWSMHLISLSSSSTGSCESSSLKPCTCQVFTVVLWNLDFSVTI